MKRFEVKQSYTETREYVRSFFVDANDIEDLDDIDLDEYGDDLRIEFQCVDDNPDPEVAEDEIEIYLDDEEDDGEDIEDDIEPRYVSAEFGSDNEGGE